MKNIIKQLTTAAPKELAELRAALKSTPRCEDCGGTGIVGDEGPGRINARHEWRPCDCPKGDGLRPSPDETRRIKALEEALNELYHRTDCTTWQMEIINRVLPQK